MTASILRPKTQAKTELRARFAYARVSMAEKQKALNGDSSKSIERQTLSLQQVDSEMEVFVDDGVSGTKVSRPGWDRCLAAAIAAAPSEIWVVHLDRLGRNHDLKTLIPNLYYQHGIHIRATDDTVPDLDEAYGGMMLDIKVNTACEEADRIGKRVRAGNEHVFRQGLNNRALAGYLLYEGRYYPDDQPRHCPLPQRCESHPGYSNFELVRMQITAALQMGAAPGQRWFDEHFPLTKVERLNRVQGDFRPSSETREDIHTVNNSQVIARWRPWGTLATTGVGLQNRIQNRLYMGYTVHRCNYNENARPSRGQRTCSANPNLLYDERHYQYATEDRTHEPVINDELLMLVDAWNARTRGVREGEGRRRIAAGGNAKVEKLSALTPEHRHRYHLSARIIAGLVCASCGKRLWRDRQIHNGRAFLYGKCNTKDCAYQGMRITLDKAIAGLAIHLAEKAKEFQGGNEAVAGNRPKRLKPQANAKLQALQEDLDYYRSKPANQVRSNQIRELERQIAAIVEDQVDDKEDITSLDLIRRLRHPRAVEAGTWIALLTGDEPTAALAMLSVHRALVAPITGETGRAASANSWRGGARWGANAAHIVDLELA